MEATELIDIICPEHDRTSCDDEHLNNGFRSYDGVRWVGRCQRCVLLQIANGEEIPKDFNYEEFRYVL